MTVVTPIGPTAIVNWNQVDQAFNSIQFSIETNWTNWNQGSITSCCCCGRVRIIKRLEKSGSKKSLSNRICILLKSVLL